jgi:hypothetical protein
VPVLKVRAQVAFRGRLQTLAACSACLLLKLILKSITIKNNLPAGNWELPAEQKSKQAESLPYLNRHDAITAIPG